MENSKTLEILKMAILMEKRGQAFYSQVAKTTESAEVRKIFEMMAKEEVLHEKMLAEQYKSYVSGGNLTTQSLPKAEDDSIAQTVITEDIKKQIKSAGYEAAAISAAIDMENNAIRIYGERAAQATDPNEKALFAWLSEWEKSHHQILLELDNELKESVWNDNQFWPF